MIHVSEAIIMGDTCKQKSKPHLPTVKDTIQILNKPIIKPSIPTINETILVNEKCKYYLIQYFNYLLIHK